ncbi:hypothetical protein [Bacillus atrophaeus]|nr:hypothetical protein [Bacillus atrophaeus]MEC0805967.1 hypothetical protein [Bacillus atrophaeus]MEC0854045.1 hypothetical protein [Bacillus atrophaeus]MEC0856986.1 hypothetical protein [Bacillus atrophaeus]MEC0861137.1 hypothetical protein [Bacillus atrophaeus]MEC0871368.1 hypothetical protein [Bacillus atrophaeus]
MSDILITDYSSVFLFLLI